MDIVGSSLALLAGLPLFVAIAIAIKLTSKGPVFFRQKRLGQYGREFSFLKFRSMYVNSDATIHREYVTRFIKTGHGCRQTRQRQALLQAHRRPTGHAHRAVPAQNQPG